MKTTRVELSYKAMTDLMESMDMVYPSKKLMESQKYEIDFPIVNPNHSPLSMDSQERLDLRMIVVSNNNGLFFRISTKVFNIKYPIMISFLLNNENKIIIEDLSNFAMNPLDKRMLQSTPFIVREEGREQMEFMVSLFGKVLEYLKKPKRVVEVNTQRREVSKTQKSDKKSKKKNIQYVYDTIYKVSKIAIDKPKEVTKDSKQDKIEREYFKDEWVRHGHYRHYRNDDGSIRKKVWIPQTVVHPKGKTKDLRDIRITKVTK